MELPNVVPCAFYDMLRSREGRESKREMNALHEAGHAFMHLLAGHPIERLRVSGALGATRNALFSCLRGVGIPTDRISFLAQGETASSSEIEESVRTGKDPELSILVYLGGLASTTQNELFQKFASDVTTWDQLKWEDIAIPRHIVEKSLREKGYEVTKGNVRAVLSSIFASLSQKLEQTRMKKVIECIQKLLLKKKDLKGSDGHTAIMTSLRSSGYDCTVFPEMLTELRNAVNIDQHISACKIIKN